MRDDNVRRKRQAVRDAEAEGLISDSMEVRMKLIKKMESGELTLDQVQSELKRVKRDGKKKGLLTRDQVYRQS